MARAPTETVKLWHEALNTGDIDRLLALSMDDIEVGGPRGASRGSSALADWVGRTGIRISPHEYFARGPVVVVDQDAAWHMPGSDAPDSQRVASVFIVRGEHVASVVRYPTLDDALDAAGLDQQDQVVP